MKQNTTVDTKDLVTTIAYLIGVRKNVLEQCFMEPSQDLLQSLYASQSATIIRYLCKLRTTLFCTFKKTDDEMRYNLKNPWSGMTIRTLRRWNHGAFRLLRQIIGLKNTCWISMI